MELRDGVVVVVGEDQPIGLAVRLDVDARGLTELARSLLPLRFAQFVASPASTATTTKPMITFIRALPIRS